MYNTELIYTKETIEFAVVAKEFLSFLESSQASSKDEFIDTSLKILPLLYLKALQLPKVEDFDDDFSEKFVDEATWSYIQQITSAKLGEDDQYVQVQDATVMNSLDSLNVGLSELYADLYQDIGDFIGAFRLGIDDTMLAALFYCQENFKTYWGIRNLILLKNLHEIKFKTEDDIDL